jgi:thiamine-phosphate pyrophosphorylase
MGEAALIGRSIHGVDEARAAEAAGGVDYLVFGTVFASTSKPPDHPVAGLETLGAAVRAGGRVPVLAIGGITLENAVQAARAGAAGVAAIGLFLGAQAPGARAAGSLRIVAEQVRRAFAEIGHRRRPRSG